MSETAGSAGIPTQREVFSRPEAFAPNHNAPTFGDQLRDAYRMRKIVKQENRRNELEAKEKRGDITNKEAMELAAMKTEETLEKIANARSSTVCYVA